jgi:hypothetical protein
MVCIGSVKALLSYQSISGLRCNQQAVLIFQAGGLSFQRWRSLVKIGLAAHGLSGVQNCVKYSAREKDPKSQMTHQHMVTPGVPRRIILQEVLLFNVKNSVPPPPPLGHSLAVSKDGGRLSLVVAQNLEGAPRSHNIQIYDHSPLRGHNMLG